MDGDDCETSLYTFVPLSSALKHQDWNSAFYTCPAHIPVQGNNVMFDGEEVVIPPETRYLPHRAAKNKYRAPLHCTGNTPPPPKKGKEGRKPTLYEDVWWLDPRDPTFKEGKLIKDIAGYRIKPWQYVTRS